MTDTAALSLLAALGAFIFVLIIIGIILYILTAVGLYKMAQNLGIQNPWLAWIPIADLYIIGKIIKNLKIGQWDIPSIEIVLPVGSVAVAILGAIPVVGTLIGIAYAVLFYFALHKLYKLYRPQSATTWLVLSIIFAFLFPIFIFVLRNDKQVA